MALKTGIVGLPNVGKVSYRAQLSRTLEPCPGKEGEGPCLIGDAVLTVATLLQLQSTLFNALCEGSHAQAANFPFCTIEPNQVSAAIEFNRVSACWQPPPGGHTHTPNTVAEAARGTVQFCRPVCFRPDMIGCGPLA